LNDLNLTTMVIMLGIIGPVTVKQSKSSSW